MAVKKAKLGIVVITFVLALICSCKNEKGSNVPVTTEKYSLYLIDNGGNCDPCAQIRYVAKSIEEQAHKEIPVLANANLITVATTDSSKSKFLDHCTAFNQEFIVTCTPSKKIKAFRKFSLESTVLDPSQAQQVIGSIVDSLKLFTDSCEGSL